LKPSFPPWVLASPLISPGTVLISDFTPIHFFLQAIIFFAVSTSSLMCFPAKLAFYARVLTFFFFSEGAALPLPVLPSLPATFCNFSRKPSMFYHPEVCTPSFFPFRLERFALLSLFLPRRGSCSVYSFLLVWSPFFADKPIGFSSQQFLRLFVSPLFFFFP